MGRWLVALGCAYELLALPKRSPLPTITSLVKTIGRAHPIGRILAWAWCGFWVWHFLVDDEVAPVP